MEDQGNYTFTKGGYILNEKTRGPFDLMYSLLLDETDLKMTQIGQSWSVHSDNNCTP